MRSLRGCLGNARGDSGDSDDHTVLALGCPTHRFAHGGARTDDDIELVGPVILEWSAWRARS